jgi:hypothetical protein
LQRVVPFGATQLMICPVRVRTLNTMRRSVRSRLTGRAPALASTLLYTALCAFLITLIPSFHTGRVEVCSRLENWLHALDDGMNGVTSSLSPTAPVSLSVK